MLNRRSATKNLTALIRGLKPTAIFTSSLREESWSAPFHRKQQGTAKTHDLRGGDRGQD